MAYKIDSLNDKFYINQTKMRDGILCLRALRSDDYGQVYYFDTKDEARAFMVDRKIKRNLQALTRKAIKKP